MAMYRILSLDGGAAYYSAGILQELELQLARGEPKSYLDLVQVFAGTSAGAWNALYLASQDKPSAALPSFLDFWQQAVDALRPANPIEGTIRGVAALLGQVSVLTSRHLRDFFINVFGKDTRLGDLKHRVVVPAFQLSNESPVVPMWKAKIFHNFDKDDPDMDELVVDVAMRSSAAPIELPIYQSLTGEGPGYADGGFVAANPAVVALAQVLDQVPESRRLDALASDIRMLSIGSGVIPNSANPQFVHGLAPWGYIPWIFDPKNPLMAVNATLSGSYSVPDYAVRRILGRNRYFRVQPIMIQSSESGTIVPISGEQIVPDVAKLLAQPATRLQVRDAVSWLRSETVDWFGTQRVAEPEAKPEVKRAPRRAAARAARQAS
jgi:patatin-like phospholipase/acyl hydrolase